MKFLKIIFIAGIMFNAVPNFSMEKFFTQSFYVDATDICPICLESAESIKKEASLKDEHFPLAITTCCKKFICKNDAEALRIQADNYDFYAESGLIVFVDGNFYVDGKKLKVPECPLCRNKPLHVQQGLIKDFNIKPDDNGDNNNNRHRSYIPCEANIPYDF